VRRVSWIGQRNGRRPPELGQEKGPEVAPSNVANQDREITQKRRPGSEEPGKSNREASRLGDVGSEDPCLGIAPKPRLATIVAEISHVLRRNTVGNLDEF